MNCRLAWLVVFDRLNGSARTVAPNDAVRSNEEVVSSHSSLKLAIGALRQSLGIEIADCEAKTV